jgi:hypothetical protein
LSGQPITFTASLDQVVSNVTHDWSVRPASAIIESGQGTQSITVNTSGVVGGNVIASVVIGGLDPNCPKEGTWTTVVVPVEERSDKSGGTTEDDFTQISQIGPARAATLQGAGIRSFKELANTPVEILKELFPAVTEDLLNEWLQGAKKRAG